MKIRVQKKLHLEEKLRWDSLKKDRQIRTNKKQIELIQNPRVGTEISEYLTINPTEFPRTLGEVEETGPGERKTYEYSESHGKHSLIQLSLGETEEKNFM